MVTLREKSPYFKCPDLRSLYSQNYNEDMLRWRRIGALDKASNIKKMVASIRTCIDSVLEVGSGTGAVLQQLAAESIGTCFSGIEIGDGRFPEHPSANIQISNYDGCTIPFPDKSFDLVYATHVLEHVLDERGFLGELRRVSRRFVYVEVPCELTLRTKRQTLQRTLDIGHINPYSPDSFALKLETSGLVIKELRVFDHRDEVYRFASPAWKATLKATIRRGLLRFNETLACRIFSYHCGALCEPGPALNI